MTHGPSVPTGHRDMTVEPSTPLAPCAGSGGDAGVPVDGTPGVDGVDGDASVGSAVEVAVRSTAVGELPWPTQPVRTRAAAAQVRTPGTTRVAARRMVSGGNSDRTFRRISLPPGPPYS